MTRRRWWMGEPRGFKLRFFHPRVESLERRTLPSFIGATSYVAGFQPYSVAVGDFNGDGIQDLAVVNFNGGSNGSVSVLLGRGDGTFTAPQSYTLGRAPDAVAVGDFNGDGKLDLAVTVDAFPQPVVSILLGHGDGTFAAPQSYAVDGSPKSVAVGDFNGDGKLDLVVTTQPSPAGELNILLGHGDGTFAAPQTYDLNGTLGSVVVGDFNGDGKLDVAVANSGIQGRSAVVDVLLGNGDGTFQPAQTFATGQDPVSVAVGDFNGDGIQDLAIANELDNSVSILLGRGDGTFAAAQSYAAGAQPISVVVGDFNGDGIQDLAVADYNASNVSVSILLGRGNGSFAAPQNYGAGVAYLSIAVGDFNGDGIQDLAITSEGSDAVNILRGRGDGTFVGVAPNYFAGFSPEAVAVGDFNGDGILDLAVADGGDSQGRGQGVSVLLGRGDGTFDDIGYVAAGQESASVAVGDFNGDGILDLVFANYASGTVGVALGNGDGTFTAVQNYAVGQGPFSVTVADFNGDGIQDLAVANYSSGTVSILLGQGNGTFAAAQNYAAGSGADSVAAGDFNGDGALDLAVATASGVSILLGHGDGTFADAQNYTAGDSPQSVAVGDFNGDGALDLAVANSSGVSILLGQGDGTFAITQNYVAGSGADSVAVGDFNGDGILDLAVANYTGVSVLLGQGDGTFTAAQNYAAGGRPQSVAVGDFNGDCALDLAVANTQSDSITVLLNAADWNGGSPGVRSGRQLRAAAPAVHRPARLAPRIVLGAAQNPQPMLQLSPATDHLLPHVSRSGPAATASGLLVRTETTSPPLPLVTIRHALDAVFAGWAEPIADDWGATV